MTDRIDTDYLVVGAGISGLAFVNELLSSSSDTKVTIVDQRDAPGGHWNDVYPFVRLHQPASFYGVESTDFVAAPVETVGPNKGYRALAGGPEVTAYCHLLMRDRLLASGRVTYLPMTTYARDGTLRARLSGRRHAVRVRRKLVDATYYTNVVPLTHERGFSVHADSACVAPNDLARAAPDRAHFTILGGGKTGVDACLWLIGHGVAPERIRWIVPRDQWYVDRATMQPEPAFFDTVFGGIAAAREDIAAATGATDLALRHEASGLWLRLDPSVMPAAFHAAHLSRGELALLRGIADVVRLGRVRAIQPGMLELERGDLTAPADTLYVDCTASALTPRPAVPVFQPGRIVLQAIRFPQIPFSAALIAFLETLPADDAMKNAFAAPLPVPTTVEDYIRALAPDLSNRRRAAVDPRVRAWIGDARLDGFASLAASVDPTATARQALLARVRQATAAAAANLPALTATLAADPGGSAGAPMRARDRAAAWWRPCG